MKFLTSIFFIVLLAGCVSKETQRKSDEYGNARELIVTQDGHFNVLEHPSGRKLLVLVDTGDAAGQGFIRGLTFGAVDLTPSEGAAQEAAETYMRKYPEAFGNCVVSNGYPLQKPAFEFVLNCT